MKAKYDFITNSSSASFIMYLEVDEEHFSKDNLLEEFKEKFQYFISDKIGEYDTSAGNKHIYPEITQISSNTIKIEEYTSMFNGSADIPCYMVDLMIGTFDNSVNDCDPPYIKNVKFEINMD